MPEHGIGGILREQILFRLIKDKEVVENHDHLHTEATRHKEEEKVEIDNKLTFW